MSNQIVETNQVSNENQETEEKPIDACVDRPCEINKIIIKKSSKPRAKPTPKIVKEEEEKPSIKVKNEIDEDEVIEFIKKNENLKKEILKILLELINKI